MDLLQQMRAGIGYVDPLTRARLAMNAVDAAEAREERERQEQRAGEIEARRAEQAAADRMSLFTTGHTAAELEQARREREDTRQARVAELEAELDQLDPVRRAARQAETRRMSQAQQLEAQLARARQVRDDPFMAAEVRRFHERGAAAGRAGYISR